MSKIKKIVSFLLYLVILIPVYYLIYLTISSVKDLKDIPYWFFSAIIQFNGSVVGLILAALGISFIMHSEKIIFLFKKKEFGLLRYTVYAFLLNVFLGFLGLSVISPDNYLIELMSLTLIIEILALIFLALIFTRSLNIFQYEVQWELYKTDAENIVRNLSVEHELSNDKRNVLFLINQDQPVFDIEGIIQPIIYRKKDPGFFSYLKDILPLKAITIPTISKFNNNRIQASYIPKEIINLMRIEDNLEFNMVLKFRKATHDFFYIIVYVALKKIDEENLKFIRKPSLIVIDKDGYNATFKNMMSGSFVIDTNLLFT